ncbi:MAG: 4'-phosphopantetheinyl transferase superfamily protein [Bacteroidales bacterium]|nr:4'-phosphopantetheinyl transferase superfamily protein [Bacteroidales bacterium]
MEECQGSRREHEHAQAYALLSRLLGEEPSSLAVAHDPKGAPFLPQRPDLHVSVSHCRTAVAAAVSGEWRVGIDVESRRKVGEGLMERVCTDEELAAVRADADPEMAFLRLWTRKEAVLKCRGTGIKGFGSMRSALTEGDCEVVDVECGVPDTVAAMAVARR